MPTIFWLITGSSSVKTLQYDHSLMLDEDSNLQVFFKNVDAIHTRNCPIKPSLEPNHNIQACISRVL